MAHVKENPWNSNLDPRVDRIVHGNNLPIKGASVSYNHLSIELDSSSSSFGSG